MQSRWKVDEIKGPKKLANNNANILARFLPLGTLPMYSVLSSFLFVGLSWRGSRSMAIIIQKSL